MITFICIGLLCILTLSYASSTAYAQDVRKNRLLDGNGVAIDQNCSESDFLLMDFKEGETAWRTINDVVMGGISSSHFYISKGKATFEGNVSFENNGGFSSARSRTMDLNLSEYTGIQLRVRGDGKRYSFRMRTKDDFGSINYESRFETVKDAWRTVSLPFSSFRAVFKGHYLEDAAPLKLQSIKTLGVLISDKQEGIFRLEIDWIKTYKTPEEKNEFNYALLLYGIGLVF